MYQKSMYINGDRSCTHSSGIWNLRKNEVRGCQDNLVGSLGHAFFQQMSPLRKLFSYLLILFPLKIFVKKMYVRDNLDWYEMYSIGMKNILYAILIHCIFKDTIPKRTASSE